MVNNEGWLERGLKAELIVVRVNGYTHDQTYSLPVPPSPNLPNDASIALYPSLCFFEGTPISVGRGTDYPFQLIGAPWLHVGSYSFIPVSNAGAKNPPYEGQRCSGINLKEFGRHMMPQLKSIYWNWLVDTYRMAPDREKFFTPFFDKLAGTDKLRKAIESGVEAEQIPLIYEDDLEAFKKIRKNYLLYP
jgi:uncharacterized protein YbbC (DUF1343 family)